MHGSLPKLKVVSARRFRRLLSAACATGGMMLVAGPVLAALPIGAKAPDFAAEAALDGKQFNFSLGAALKRGPVVVYFYPAAFTKGCTIEAHDFAEAIPDFKAAGASVIGVSEDKIETLDKFSVSECQGKFPVAADADGSIAKSYDARLPVVHTYASRTSYVIAPDGTVLESYEAMSPDNHVQKTLDAVRAFQAHGKS